MEYVRLSVPKHLYDELGLRPNQTITLKNLQNVRKNDIDESNDSSNSSEASDHYPNPLLTNVKKNKTVDEKANDSSQDETSDSGTNDIDNASAGSDVDDTLSANLDDASCDSTMSKKPKMNEVNVVKTSQSSVENQNATQRMLSIKKGRTCKICSRTFTHNSMFWHHRNECGNSSYPKLCPKCKGCFTSSKGYTLHKKYCVPSVKKSSPAHQSSKQGVNELNVAQSDVGSSNSCDVADNSEKWSPVSVDYLNTNKFFIWKNKSKPN